MEIVISTSPRLIVPVVAVVFWLYCCVRGLFKRGDSWEFNVAVGGLAITAITGLLTGITYLVAVVATNNWTPWS